MTPFKCDDSCSPMISSTLKSIVILEKFHKQRQQQQVSTQETCSHHRRQHACATTFNHSRVIFSIRSIISMFIVVSILLLILFTHTLHAFPLLLLYPEQQLSSTHHQQSLPKRTTFTSLDASSSSSSLMVDASIPAQYKIFTVAGSFYLDSIHDEYALSEYAPLGESQAVVVNSWTNEIFISDSKKHVIRVIDAKNSTLRVYCGTGAAGFNGEGLDALETQLNGPTGLYLAQNGDLYVADTLNGMVRKISASTRKVTTIISNQELTSPVGVFVTENNGDVYVTDSVKGLVKHYNATTGKVSLVAGGGNADRDYVLATTTKLTMPTAIYVTHQGTIYISVIDTEHSRIRKIEGPVIGQQQIITIAGQASRGVFQERTHALLNSFSAIKGLYVKPNGDILVADAGQHAVRVIPPDFVFCYTLAGDGRALNQGEYISPKMASILQPSFIYMNSKRDVFISGKDQVKMISNETGLIRTLVGKFNANTKFGDGLKATSNGVHIYPVHAVVSESGELFLTDGNGHHAIRKVSKNGIITTVAGIMKQTGFNGDNLRGDETLLSFPTCLFMYKNGELLISDYVNQRLRVFQTNGNVTTILTNVKVEAIFALGENSTDVNGAIYYATIKDIFKYEVSTKTSKLLYTFQGPPVSSSGMIHVINDTMDGPILYFAELEAKSIVKLYERNLSLSSVYNVTNEVLRLKHVHISNESLYFVEGDSMIKALSLKDNSVRLIAGIPPNGDFEFTGYEGEGFKANETMIKKPSSLFMTSQGELVFTEEFERVRKISHDGTLLTLTGRNNFSPISKALSTSVQYANSVSYLSLSKELIIQTGDDQGGKYLTSLVNQESNTLTHLSGFRSVPLFAQPIDYHGPLKYAFMSNTQSCQMPNGDIITVARDEHVVYKYSRTTGNVSVIAGSIRMGGVPQDGPALQTLFQQPKNPICLENGDLIFLTGRNQGKIVQLEMTTGRIVSLHNATGSLQAVAVSPLDSNLIYFVEFAMFSLVKMKNLTSGTISVVAGNGIDGYLGEDVPALDASLRLPTSLLFLKNGDLLIADDGNGLIRKVSHRTQRIHTIAGTTPSAELCNYNGNGRLSTRTCLQTVASLSLGNRGEIYFADRTAGLVRKLVPYCNLEENGSGNRTLDSSMFLECLCPNGYFGSSCELTSCFGVESWNTSKACSGNGKCQQFNQCSCREGFSGEKCETIVKRESSLLPTNSETALIVGVVVGVVGGCLILSSLVVLILILGLLFVKRRNKRNKPTEQSKQIPIEMNLTSENTNSFISDFPSDASVNFTPLMMGGLTSGTLSAESRGQQHIDPFSRYQQIVKIGQGAFGSVFKAVDTKCNGKIKAVKVMKFSSLTELNSIMKEGMQLMNIRHENILKVNDLFLSKDQLVCMDMDFYENGDLNKFTTTAPGHARECSEKIVRQVIFQICNALSYVHGTLNIIHRDIKPSNIFIQSYDEKKQRIKVVLADFGLAKGNQNASISELQSYAGTPLYMSPEIGLGSKYYANTDVYSLGVTIYQMITKDVSTSISHLMLTKDQEEIRKMLKAKMMMENENQTYSEELVDIVLRMLEKDSLMRPNAQDILSLPYFQRR
ncbi:hypothetical protein C9374_012036 [Naegleria lovaniensis]|uniref:non-specific serine/threonine protein kinase n=1 Tax=Naegleria lovaniensis TaxID=51637 RepID=A0AA88GEU9_NAELO|nr:uncharacterized protein C9374_012036 [Naegleria lovaniensis]KAG2373573.1 hypothetical protein C9374_012036 [Naegleria lovaniensis]